MRSLLVTKKTSYTNISVFFIICFSFYWATNVMSISPIYFTTMLGFVAFAFAYRYKIVPNSEIFIYLWHFLYAFWFLVSCAICNRNLHEALVTAFFGLFYIIADIILYQINEKNTLNKFIKLYFYLFIIYYLVDFYMRYKTSQQTEVPTWIQANPIFMFYMLKDGGLNGDSNTIGVFCCVFFAVMFFCRKLQIVKKRYVIMAFLLTVLSCSRAAIVSCIAMLLFDKFYLEAKAMLRILMIFFSFAVALYIFNLFLNDPSFQTKVDIFQKTFQYELDCSIFDFLFGIGPNNSTKVLGRYAHNIWSVTFIEYGFIQLVFFILMMFFTFFDVGKRALYIYTVFFLVSLSYTTIFLQFLFVGLALTKHISRIYNLDERLCFYRSIPNNKVVSNE